MQFWFARGSEVPVRQQLVTQVVLGILCNDLAPGRRLPSTRELARRFHLHPNTVSAAYRQLGKEKWVEFRKGSGVYVRAVRPKAAAGSTPESLIANLVLASRAAGLSLDELRRRVRHWLDLHPPTQFVLIEPDEELRKIVLAELAAAVHLPVRGCGFGELRQMDARSAVFLALPSKAEAAREALAAEAELMVLRVRSAPMSMAQCTARKKAAKCQQRSQRKRREKASKNPANGLQESSEPQAKAQRTASEKRANGQKKTGEHPENRQRENQRPSVQALERLRFLLMMAATMRRKAKLRTR